MNSQQFPITAASTRIYPPPEDSHRGDPFHPDDCAHCNGNYYSVAAQANGLQRYQGLLSINEARAEINSLLYGTMREIASLKDVLQDYGNLIASRWSKKSTDKRGRLLSASAEFCFGAWPPGPSTGRIIDTSFTEWYPEESKNPIWPYAAWIQAKDFAEDSSKLLTLLHLRTEYPPQDWAIYDTSESREAFVRATDLPYNSQCVEMFGKNYGNLLEYDSGLIHTWAIMSFPRALVTFRTQRAILKALRVVVDQIITNAQPSGNSKWNDLVLNLNKKGGEARWTFYDIPALVPPYGFNTKTLLDKTTSKFNELFDDLEFMCTDPEYMLNAALTRKASIRFKDAIPTATKWHVVAVNLINNRFAELLQWARVLDACRVVHEVFEKYGENIRPGEILPPEVGNAMAIYHAYTDEAIAMQCELFRDALMQMEALKDCFAIVKTNRGYKWTHLRPLDPSRKDDCLLATALAVESTMQHRMPCGARMAIQFLLGKLSSIRYEKAVDEEISSLALLDEMRLAQIWSQLGPFEVPEGGLDRFLEPHVAHGSGSSVHDTSPRKEKASKQTITRCKIRSQHDSVRYSKSSAKRHGPRITDR